MSKRDSVDVKKLTLDLENFRTVAQPDEAHALHSIIAINPDWFWALTASLLESGYLLTENVIVLKSGGKPAELVVKEGNRRVGAIKLILGHIDASKADIDIPDEIQKKIDELSDEWKASNSEVPCVIYEASDSAIVDRIVALVHGKGEQAGRAKWKSVARARHARKDGANEPGLDLLEKFLDKAKNVTQSQREVWAGDYPLTVLDDAIKRVADRFGATSATDLATKYPSVKHRQVLDEIIRDIGMKVINFKEVRNDDFAGERGAPAAQEAESAQESPDRESSESTSDGSESASRKKAASATNNPNSVKGVLRNFKPLGSNREKVVTLRDEAKHLDIRRTPLAFCFLLRSMFEISAKAYCEDHDSSGGPKYKRANGYDRNLIDVLRDITKHLTNDNKNTSMTRALHGAMAELGKPEGLLSVTSMNQLVHHPSFSLSPGDICTMFHNVFPLLREMNQ